MREQPNGHDYLTRPLCDSKQRFSENLDLDLLKTGVLALCQVHDKHCIFELRTDVAGVGIIREREGAPETAARWFDPWAFLFILLLELAVGHDS